MDYGKLDAGLRSALSRYENNPGYRYTVFIHTAYPAGEKEIKFMQGWGIPKIKPGRKIITAALPAAAIAVLSDQPWVSVIRLSRTLKPVEHQKDGR